MNSYEIAKKFTKEEILAKAKVLADDPESWEWDGTRKARLTPRAAKKNNVLTWAYWHKTEQEK